MDPKGKCAVITGAASGLGLAITRELLKHGLQTVMMADINKDLGEQVCNDLDKEFETSNIRFTHMDVTKDEDYERVFKKARSIYGSIDIVVNNAGIVDDIDYEKQLAVNIGGVIRGTLLGLQYMGKDNVGQGGGIIMNMASVSAVQPLDAVPVYSATKAAILALSRSFGTRYHYNRTGVRVVTLCPAFTETPLLSTNKVFTDCQPAYTKLKESYVSQKPESVGLAAIYIIKNAESESVWVVESNKLHKLQMPFWKNMCSYVEEYSPDLSRL